MTLKLGFLVESKDQLHLLFQFYESVYLATLNAEVLYWNTLKSLLFIFNSLTLTVNLLDDTDHIELKKNQRNRSSCNNVWGVFDYLYNLLPGNQS